MAQTVKNPPAMREAQLRSLGREDPLEKEMAAHSSMLAWSTPRTEEPGGVCSPRAAESDMAEATAHQKREGRTKEENVLNSSVGREFALTLLSLEMTE